ncbi:Phosphotransferase system HPr enzyme [Lachnospiraceae bacterium TWA4]|nr:Phosphotransferase system HPr enzyme [Lachnospiraceae bacterium TWA4]
MISQKVIIKNLTGLHLRPAGVLCTLAMDYQCQVQFKYKKGIANAKSVLSVLGAGIKYGDEIEFICEGVDEADALSAIVEAVHQGLGDK